ncbi:TPA: Protein transport protein Sec23A [Trebouxia sp. C0006]
MASFDLQQSYQAPTLPPISSNHQSPVPAISSLSPDQTYAKSVAAEIVSLTSTTVLRSRYSLSKAAVPFGALVTPLPNLHSPSLPPLLQRSPTVCDACGAYLNAYCKVRVRQRVYKSRPCQPWQFCQLPNDHSWCLCRCKLTTSHGNAVSAIPETILSESLTSG